MRRGAQLAFSVALLAATGALVLRPAGAASEPPKPGASVVLPINDTPGWAVRANVDKADRTYRPGEFVVIDVLSEKKGFVYLFNVDSAGEITLLLPNFHQKDNAIAASPPHQPSPLTFGAAGSGVRFQVSAENSGVEHIKAVVTRDRVPQLDKLAASATDKEPIVVLTAKQYDAALREVAFRGSKTAPDSGDLARDLDAWKRDVLRPAKIVPKPEKEYTEQAQSWSEHRVEIYTGKGAEAARAARRVALVVGIDQYKSPDIRSLSCAVKDAVAMESALKKAGKFDAVTVLTDKDATHDAVRKAFARLVETTRPGDTVLVFWSGHGGRCENADGTESDGFDEFLVPHDGGLDSEAEIRRTMILDKAFGRWVMELSERKIVVILDTCHSGGQIAGTKFPVNGPRNRDDSPRHARGVNTPKLPAQQKWTEPTFVDSELKRYGALRTRNIRRTDAAVLAACAPRQFAFERADGANGVLTGFILEALEDKTLPAKLTLRDLFTYADKRVQDYAKKEFPGSPQTPVFADDTGLNPPAYIRP